MAIPILVFFPFLLLFTSRTKFYPQFFMIARWWAAFILYGMGFYPRIKREQKLVKGESYMLVANHTSMTDIMLMLVTVKNPFVFVGKKELVKIPLFGYFYKRTCILVDRGNQRSRKEVFDSAQRRLNSGTSICIFPEGGVPVDTSMLLDSFKDGAFRLAIDHQIPIVPIVFFDNKKRFPYIFTKGSPGRMRVKIKEFIPSTGMTQVNKKELRENTRAVILEELIGEKTG
jgi:1-acyl-sn-glycerol-3-phosphate acyltransferase